MSVLQVYLSWVNSVLSDEGSKPCPGVTTVQQGKIVYLSWVNSVLSDEGSKPCPGVTTVQQGKIVYLSWVNSVLSDEGSKPCPGVITVQQGKIVYLSWVNSVLSDEGSKPCPGVTTVQQGKIVCQLIDKLHPEAQLQRKAECTQNVSPQVYLRVALDHMRLHGIKFHFTPQDILDGDIKSILDVLWLIILNYAVHSIGSSPYQRSVGIGKKLLLDWCQRELNQDFDPQNSLTYNLEDIRLAVRGAEKSAGESLCTGDWFLKLLAKNSDRIINDNLDREYNLSSQLSSIEKKYGIKKALISPSDITEGTVDEHTLMIYISLLRLKIGDTVDVPLKSPREISFHSTTSDRPTAPVSTSHTTPPVPSITFSEVGTTSPVKADSTGSSPTQSPPRKTSYGTDPDTSDWNSQSSGSPMSSTHENGNDQQSPVVPPEAESLIKETISKHVEEQISPRDSDNNKIHSSRIPVRVKPGEDPHRSMSSPGRIEGDDKVSRKISIRVQRPRSPNSIMAEARIKQEQEKERQRKEKEERQERDKHRKDETVMTGSASESGGDPLELGSRVKTDLEADPIKSDEDDIVRDIDKSSRVIGSLPKSEHMNGELENGVPVFVVPGQKHDMELLLEALRYARTEANVQDQLIQNGAKSDQPDFKQVIDQNIEKLEAQLAAVKAQSKEMFDEKKSDNESQPRSRTPVRELQSSPTGEQRSPPRGILDVMANQHITPDETTPKDRYDRTASPSSRLNGHMTSPAGILRYRNTRSPSDHARLIDRDLSDSEWQSPERRPLSSADNKGNEEQDADKRLIKFLTNEIENLKLKMAVVEQKNHQRAQSPYGMGPRVTSGLPERDRSPGQISSRARARHPEVSPDRAVPYSPTRRWRSTELLDEQRPRSRSGSPRYLDERRSRSPRFADGARSPRFDERPSSRSPTRSPIRSRTPDRLIGDRVRPFSPSARVLSLQDLSTSIYSDPEGKVTFSPASGARPVDLGYSSPISKVTQEIWSYNQTDDDYYADTAKYDGWKKLISQDAVSDEDMLELKQALASALVELNILQAKVKNANSDMKTKMAKTTEVLNECRANITKSQAENAELRSHIEREKTKSDAQELRIKDMEKNLHKSKVNQDDHALELEESVITLKGIVNHNKGQMEELEVENDKLRKKISDFQRENVKLKEDFNELKMYNDKAQTTIKDLKGCLDDARKERQQLIEEVKKLAKNGMNNTISTIVNNYMEKGLYEDAEKEDLKPRSRSSSPTRYDRARSSSPILTRTTAAYRPISPVAKLGSFYNTTYNPISRPVTPVSRPHTPIANSFSFDDISPAVTSDGYEIYPHRRTRSYLKKFGNNEESTPVDLNDPELQELLKPQSKLNFDIDLNDNSKQDSEPGVKRQLLYSPYMDKDYVPKGKKIEESQSSYPLVYNQKLDDHVKEVPQKPVQPATSMYKTSQRKSSFEEEIENQMFVHALDSAVKQTPAQLAQERFYRELDRMNDGPDISPQRWRSPSKGILKTAKSVQNMSIKENMSPKRSIESRSYSPAVRSPLTRSPDRQASRSFTPDSRTPRSYNQTAAPNRSYSSSNSQNRPYSSPNVKPSPGQRSFSPGNRSHSPGDRFRNTSMRDSGYSTPTHSNRSRSTGNYDNRDYNRPRTPSAANKFDGTKADQSKSPLLSEEERRYADLLIDKYTRQHLIGMPVTST